MDEMCMCCGNIPAVGEHHHYHKIAEFCENCNDMRCDAYPNQHERTNEERLLWAIFSNEGEKK